MFSSNFKYNLNQIIKFFIHFRARDETAAKRENLFRTLRLLTSPKFDGIYCREMFVLNINGFEISFSLLMALIENCQRPSDTCDNGIRR